MTDVRPAMTRPDAVRAAVRARGWVLDVDGCLVRTATAGGTGGVPIPGAVELLRWLRRSERDFIVCTNASQRPVQDYAKHLRAIGLDVADGEMMTAATAAADHIAIHHRGLSVLVVGDRGLEAALLERQIELAQPGGAPAGVVVVGAADVYASSVLNAACLAIADHGAAFYVTVDTPWFHGGIGRSIASSSAIAAAIAAVTGRKAEVCGKPSPAIGEVLQSRLGGDGSRIVVVGDMASIEIRLAHQMGALGVLVMSGGTSAAEIPGLEPTHRPHLQVADVGALVELIKTIEPQGDNNDQST
ncbi:sugar phosphatase of the HAD superfamily [Aromatoleum aromaticum EbN1]|uniref:Sugar phosphatase of the HAD superfamily n=1 Tax=Aromatoleum aromaticum (strain DSM 19018 / LMG 30748 / EbN1) TaxID=76114 RepID=Q5NZV8_AROAE|nr:HAD hydrolase-like protein [Aromatoleum aromaticum]CAI09406.1 sugar phosphatase of the HAD superfamily [Aromatoleum aromaticum EbN1]